MDIPRPRWAHCCVCVGGKILLWGGIDEHRDDIPASVVQTLGPTSGRWGTVHTTGTAPLAVCASAAVAVGRRLYNFGGGQPYSKDLHCMDSALMEWMKMETSNPSDGPSPKFSFGFIRRGEEELVVVGGELGDGIHTTEIHAISIREGGHTRVHVRCYGLIIVTQCNNW